MLRNRFISSIIRSFLKKYNPFPIFFTKENRLLRKQKAVLD